MYLRYFILFCINTACIKSSGYTSAIGLVASLTDLAPREPGSIPAIPDIIHHRPRLASGCIMYYRYFILFCILFYYVLSDPAEDVSAPLPPLFAHTCAFLSACLCVMHEHAMA